MKTLIAALWVPVLLQAQQRPEPILDMHLHASPIAEFAALGLQPPIPHCVPMTDYPPIETGRQWPQAFTSPNLTCRRIMSATTDDELRQRTFAVLERRNIIALTSGANTLAWTQAAPGRILPSRGFSGGPGTPFDSLRAWLRARRFVAIGEVSVQYGGVAPDDPSMEPLWALAEELDVPVGIHIGTGPVGAPYIAPFARYRARLHSALLLEEVLVRHPGLRVYIMHAGWPMIDDLLAVLWAHPQVHVDVGALAWALPRAEFHYYLERIVQAGFAKRVMFGSDQMVWPDAIELSIEAIETATFLTAEQRRDIFYNNAARFLRLSSADIARHHGR